VDSAPPSAVSAGLLAAQREKHTSNAKPRAPSVMSGCCAARWLASARQSCAQRVPAFERPAGRKDQPSAGRASQQGPQNQAAMLFCRCSVETSQQIPYCPSMRDSVLPGSVHRQLQSGCGRNSPAVTAAAVVTAAAEVGCRVAAIVTTGTAADRARCLSSSTTPSSSSSAPIAARQHPVGRRAAGRCRSAGWSE
jgi:hypothetical protein